MHWRLFGGRIYRELTQIGAGRAKAGCPDRFAMTLWAAWYAAFFIAPDAR
jgi:hypothetical protein